MEQFIKNITEINSTVNSFAWGWFGLILLLGTGLICTVITRCFQITHFSHWWGKTIGSVLKKDTHKKQDKGSVSQFQALCTALAATIGTGNIAGVSAAICIGGPGAVFWMWIAAFLGMMTNFSENVLGIYYRKKNPDGEWSGGAMYYLRDGLGSYEGCAGLGKVLAVIFSVFASTPPSIDTSAQAVTQVWMYIGELAFNMLVLVGTIKASDRVVREMMGI